MSNYSRRQLLAAVAGTAFSFSLPRLVSADVRRRLACGSRVIEVNGKAAKVFGLGVEGAASGMTLGPDQRFRIALVNRLSEATLIHWHGQTPPNPQDGVPGVTQPPLQPGGEYLYDFRPRPGSHWMHSHLGLQRQNLLSAPLIVRSSEDLRADIQDHVVFLHDFTFRDPEEIMAGLMSGKGHGHVRHAPVHGDHNPPKAGISGQSSMQSDRGMAEPGSHQHGHGHQSREKGHAAGHLNDVEFDAYLTNDRTLDDPDVLRVDRGGRIRLRFINAAASTNFLIDLGTLHGEVVSTDGNPVHPAKIAGLLPIAMAQRLDVVVRVPAQEGSWPILALREGEIQRTGLILATRNAHVRKISALGDQSAPAADTRLEEQLTPLERLTERTATRRIGLRLTGAMTPYRWGINGNQWGQHTPIGLKTDDRVELTFKNETGMSHPMHIHGHHFQVSSINGKELSGPLRDTVLVPMKGQVTVTFDAGTPGRWLVHCHNSYHMSSGMMSELVI